MTKEAFGLLALPGECVYLFCHIRGIAGAWKMTQICEHIDCEKPAMHHCYEIVTGGIYLCEEHYATYMRDFVPIKRKKVQMDTTNKT